VVLTRSPPPAEVEARLAPGDLVLADATDPGALSAAMRGVDEVVLCAGGLLPAASERDPDRDAELTLGLVGAVLDALEAKPGARLVSVSSGGTVYGRPERFPVDEAHPTRPIGRYGEVRVAAEELVLRRAGLAACRLRCATVYGEYQPPDRGQGAIPTFLHHVRNDEAIELYGDGTTVRDFVYAGDVGRAVVALLDGGALPPVLNVGSGQGVTVGELVGLIEAQTGRPAQIVQRPARAFDVPAIVLDIERLTELVGADPTPLEDGLALTDRWLAGSRGPAEVL
jgi:UDP-glucose 4-epimerase